MQIKECSQDSTVKQAIGQEPVEPVNDSVHTDDTEYKSVRSSIDKLLNLDIPGFDNSDDKEEGSSKRIYKCKKNR